MSGVGTRCRGRTCCLATRTARNLILLDDPLQLAQVSQGTHPPGTELSVLEHLLGDHPTVPPDMGVFLERTRRMHPEVCRLVSEVVYGGRLDWTPDVARQTTAFGTGLRWMPVDHEGNQVASQEEAARVAAGISGMVGAPWTNAKGGPRACGRRTSWWWRLASAVPRPGGGVAAGRSIRCG